MVMVKNLKAAKPILDVPRRMTECADLVPVKRANSWRKKLFQKYKKKNIKKKFECLAMLCHLINKIIFLQIFIFFLCIYH